MSKVIQFKPRKPPEPPQWYVHDCISSQFYLADNGIVVCCKCNQQVGNWQK